MVRKLDIDGDAQAGISAGHGGEQRAVFVYQMDLYHYWENFLPDVMTSPTDSSGDNFTVEVSSLMEMRSASAITIVTGGANQ